MQNQKDKLNNNEETIDQAQKWKMERKHTSYLDISRLPILQELYR